ncbi:hypothetical protein SO694_00021441 [Aureococcus anophagefferens]|uniref:Alpha-MPP n=1 Tax=Aureococcus anophagefferens TaxID=44056 RepID=A0ABR1FU79_AURAN
MLPCASSEKLLLVALCRLGLFGIGKGGAPRRRREPWRRSPATTTPRPPAGAGGALPLAPGAVVEAGDPSVYVLPCAPGSRRLELRLVVKCGSALERDDERGFAHFCEHLAFRTTTNFYASGASTGCGLLRKLGSAYGPDVNASTNVFDTTYRLSLALPQPTRARDADAPVREALGVLAKWLYGATCGAADVDGERPVILQEERDGRGRARRLATATSRRFARPWRLPAPALRPRVPVGLPAVVAAATPEALGAFRARWYGRPGARVVVAAGDAGDGGARARARAVVPAGPPGTVAVALSDADLDAATVPRRLEPLASANTAAAVEAEVARAVYASLLDRALDEVARGDDARPSSPRGVSGAPRAKTRCTAITARVAAGGAARGSAPSSRRAARGPRSSTTTPRGGVARARAGVFERRRGDREAPDALADDAARHFLNGGASPSRARAPRRRSRSPRSLAALRGARQALRARAAAPGGGLSVAVLQQPAGADALSDDAWAAAVRAADRERARRAAAARAPPRATPSRLCGSCARAAGPRGPSPPSARRSSPSAAASSSAAAAWTASDGGAGRCPRAGLRGRGLADLDDGDVAGRAALALLDDALLESRVGAATGAAFRDAACSSAASAACRRKQRHRGIGGSCGAGGLERLLALLRARFEPGALSVDDGARAPRRGADVASNAAVRGDAAIGLAGGFAAGGGDAAAWAGLLADAKTQRVEAHARKLRHRSYWLFYLLDAYKLARRAGARRAAGDAVEDAAASHATRAATSSGPSTPRPSSPRPGLFPAPDAAWRELFLPPLGRRAADDAAAAAAPPSPRPPDGGRRLGRAYDRVPRRSGDARGLQRAPA